MLEKFARENHFRNIRHFTDDGYSGTNFNRPDWQRMIAMVDAGQISTVIVKDMSRIGRNYLEVGMYTDIKFPNSNVRFIAVNNGVDSANQQENDFTPFLNIINEFYVKDTSKKIRAVMKNKGESGEYLCTNPPYGYRKDPENPKKHWLVDEEAAQVVKRIFSLCMEGYGPSQRKRTRYPFPPFMLRKMEQTLPPKRRMTRTTGPRARSPGSWTSRNTSVTW